MNAITGRVWVAFHPKLFSFRSRTTGHMEKPWMRTARRILCFGHTRPFLRRSDYMRALRCRNVVHDWKCSLYLTYLCADTAISKAEISFSPNATCPPLSLRIKRFIAGPLKSLLRPCWPGSGLWRRLEMKEKRLRKQLPLGRSPKLLR